MSNGTMTNQTEDIVCICGEQKEGSEYHLVMNRAEFYLEDLKSKFQKINPSDYYLAYSGGRDSHFLLWFIKEYLKEDRIISVFSNTGMEIPEIRDRGLANAQIVTKPVINHWEIKEKYGIPLNSKSSDGWVYDYQRYKEMGTSDDDMPNWIKYYAMRQVDAIERGKKTGMLSFSVVNKKTSEAMIAGTLHKVSNRCCDFLKKKPAHLFEKESNKKPIVGIMSDESWRRNNIYRSCFTSKGKFVPLWDLTEDLRNEIEREFDIPVPSVYKYLNQTGCAGCPYGQHGSNKFANTNIALGLCTNTHREFILEYFKESYKFKGYRYEPKLFY